MIQPVAERLHRAGAAGVDDLELALVGRGARIFPLVVVEPRPDPAAAVRRGGRPGTSGRRASCPPRSPPRRRRRGSCRSRGTPRPPAWSSGRAACPAPAARWSAGRAARSPRARRPPPSRRGAAPWRRRRRATGASSAGAPVVACPGLLLPWSAVRKHRAGPRQPGSGARSIYPGTGLLHRARDLGALRHLVGRHDPPERARRVGERALLADVEAVAVDREHVAVLVVAAGGELQVGLRQLLRAARPSRPSRGRTPGPSTSRRPDRRPACRRSWRRPGPAPSSPSRRSSSAAPG